MKRILFLFIVFVFTTAGFLKSALEECADSKTLMWQISPSAEWKSVKKTASEFSANAKTIALIKKFCPFSGCTFRNNWEIIELGKTHKQVKVRDIPLSEQERKFKKFLNQSVKKKLKDERYEKNYKICIREKKNSPELFEAKYD